MCFPSKTERLQRETLEPLKCRFRFACSTAERRLFRRWMVHRVPNQRTVKLNRDRTTADRTDRMEEVNWSRMRIIALGRVTQLQIIVVLYESTGTGTEWSNFEW